MFFTVWLRHASEKSRNISNIDIEVVLKFLGASSRPWVAKIARVEEKIDDQAISLIAEASQAVHFCCG